MIGVSGDDKGLSCSNEILGADRATAVVKWGIGFVSGLFWAALLPGAFDSSETFWRWSPALREAVT